ncbi:GNAT family N-acetyltransferase [Amycolatopsis regifaucium]|uniref:Acetyltransferase n=1 Tax=Amycolatopsis regifaucium TaxID=546365 RepID=A0A154M4E6_9PSEU|nr:GNAT family N-acetyltransferase [Amycolatopsis regifaucium]KZB79501.1 acetyltransferase [Amycolatopsis regifaucium]OKA07683.1 GNAT family N-acetyltransferase [Amycolatopsis regifaucium]SFH05495.1 Protein N-acetyltransferase, RimJ/RimL family [Amycolatopsis regifaucium]
MEAPAETLTDDVIVLRRWKPEQLGTLAAVAGDSAEHLGAWMIWAANGYGREEAAEFLEASARNWAEGKCYDFAILFEKDLVGGTGMISRPYGIEIGYWLSHRHTGRGFATRAARLLTDEAFRLGAPEVAIRHDEKNVASGAVPARLGFTMTGSEAAEPPLAPACTGVHRVWRLKRP